MGLAKSTWSKLKVVAFIFLIIIVAVYVRRYTTPVEHVLVTFNVHETGPLELQELLGVLDEYGVKSTFFISGEWAAANPELTRQLVADGHEVACYTMTGARLSRVADENLSSEIEECKSTLEEIIGGEVIGFRAPHSEVGKRVYEHLDEFTYDSSIYQRYGWFWETPPQTLKELPISSFIFIPLDARVGVETLHIGDMFFYLARKSRQRMILLSFTPELALKRKLDFEYVLGTYEQEGANFISIRDWLDLPPGEFNQPVLQDGVLWTDGPPPDAAKEGLKVQE